jgi:hypothetical protein
VPLDPVVPLVLLPDVPADPVDPVEPLVPACPVVVSRDGVALLPLELLDEPGELVAALPEGLPGAGVAPPCVPCGLVALGLPPAEPPLAPPPACANASPVANARATDVAMSVCFFIGDSCLKCGGVAE